jgi:hypothetical protein
VLAAQGSRQAEAALGAGGVDVAMALPTVVANMHDYFTHVAAKLERVHNEVRLFLIVLAAAAPSACCHQLAS